MPTRHFAGNSLAAFFRTSVAITEVTTAGRFDPAFVSSAISMQSGSDFAASPPFGPCAGTQYWAFGIYTPNALASSSGLGPSLYSGATPVFRVIPATNHGNPVTNFQCQYWNTVTAAWVNTGPVFPLTVNTLYRVAVKIVLATSFELRIGGTLVTNGGGWVNGTAAFDTVRNYPMSSQGPTFYSEVMVADYNIIDSRYKPTPLDGNSAINTGGASGVFGDINETTLNEATSVVVGVSGNQAGFTMAPVALPAGYIIGAMVINGRGRVAGEIVDGKLGVRGSLGTESSGAGLAYSGAYEPRCRIVDADPDTATNFTEAGYNASEIYLEAV